MLSRADMEALIPVVEGRMPLLITVNRASDIREALALARDEKLKLILESASEGWRVAGEIAAAGVPVMLTPIENTHATLGLRGEPLSHAARRAAAGAVSATET